MSGGLVPVSQGTAEPAHRQHSITSQKKEICHKESAWPITPFHYINIRKRL
jgi:hypothetical protein